MKEIETKFEGMTEDKIIYECQKNKPLMVALFKLNKINKWYEKKLNLMEK
jgi:hypothetical protein